MVQIRRSVRKQAAPVVVTTLAACGFLCAERAHADDKERRVATLIYRGSAGAHACNDRAVLEEGVASRLGYLPFTASADLRFSVQISHHGPSLEASLEVSESGKVVKKRNLRSPSGDCRELTDALAVAISIVIDPMSLGRPVGVPTASASASTSAAPSASAAIPAYVEPPTVATISSAPRSTEPSPVVSNTPLVSSHVPSSRSGVRVGAWGQAVVGEVPALGLGGAIGVSYRNTNWSLGLGIGVRSSLLTVQREGAEIRATSVHAQPTICGHSSWFFVCPTMVLGSYRAHAQGLDGLHDSSTLYAAAGARVGVEAPLSGLWSLTSFFDVLGTMTPIEIRVAGADVWKTSPVSGALSLGLLGKLP